MRMTVNLAHDPIRIWVKPNLKNREYIRVYGIRAILPGKTEAAVRMRTDQK